jgi:hypothetical protein
MANNNYANELAQLQREFGNQIASMEPEVLCAVIEMHSGNVQATIQFLRAGQGDFVEDVNATDESRLPANFMAHPPNYSAAKLAERRERLSRAAQLKQMFFRESSLREHVETIGEHRGLYVAVASLLLHYRVELTAGTKARLLAAAWHAKEYDFGDYALSFGEQFMLPDVLRALRMLDGPRRVRALEKRLARLRKQASAKARTMAEARAALIEAENELFEGQPTSVSGALARRVQRWLSTIEPWKLEFYLLQMPTEPWRDIADLVHPRASHFSLDYFLPTVFGAVAPDASIVRACAQLDADNADALVANYDVPYSFVRRRVAHPSDAIKARIAAYERLSVVIWYYEELRTADVDALIEARLDRGEEPTLSYGKLMERLLFFKMNSVPFYSKLIPIAERRLGELDLVLGDDVMVIGDASYSMDVAIRTGTIIASLLCVLGEGDLRFFNDRVIVPERLPTDVESVLHVASTTKADGLTAPAVALKDLYERRHIVRYFVCVTDEIENESHEGEFFAQLFYRYYVDVYPAKLLFVSFLDDPQKKGRMVTALESFGIEPLQFVLDQTRPDLSKLDSLLGKMSSECKFFSTAAEDMARQIEADNVPVRKLIETIAEQSSLERRRRASASTGAASSSGAAAAAAASSSIARPEHVGGAADPSNEVVLDPSLEVES